MFEPCLDKSCLKKVAMTTQFVDYDSAQRIKIMLLVEWLINFCKGRHDVSDKPIVDAEISGMEQLNNHGDKFNFDYGQSWEEWRVHVYNLRKLI